MMCISNLSPFCLIFLWLFLRMWVFYPYLNGFSSASQGTGRWGMKVWGVIKYHTLYIRRRKKISPRKERRKIKNTHIWHPQRKFHPKKYASVSVSGKKYFLRRRKEKKNDKWYVDISLYVRFQKNFLCRFAMAAPLTRCLFFAS